MTDALRAELKTMGITPREIGKVVGFDVEGDAKLNEILGKAIASGAQVHGVLPKRESLEDIFVRRAI